VVREVYLSLMELKEEKNRDVSSTLVAS
jgi:hypothetical protein